MPRVKRIMRNIYIYIFNTHKAYNARTKFNTWTRLKFKELKLKLKLKLMSWFIQVGLDKKNKIELDKLVIPV